MSPGSLDALLTLVWPHAAAMALCAARLLPVALLCPVLGGQAAPGSVRLGVVLSLAGGLHFAGGVAAPADLDAWALVAAALREAGFGVALGLVAALPFDAARIGGRLADLFRGTSAEASLPGVGTRESATGEGLHQLLVALAVSSGASSWAVCALWRSFAAVPAGGPSSTEALVEQVASVAGTGLATGLAIGAPVAGLALAADAAVGLVGRAAPQLHLPEIAAPLRILGGGALLWLSVGAIAQRLLAEAVASGGWIRAAAEAAR